MWNSRNANILHQSVSQNNQRNRFKEEVHILIHAENI